MIDVCTAVIGGSTQMLPFYVLFSEDCRVFVLSLLSLSAHIAHQSELSLVSTMWP